MPLGTGNLLARNLGPLEPAHLQANINTAIHGATREIDTVDIMENEGTGMRRGHFLVIAGSGMDAEVMGDTRDDLKTRGRLAGLRRGRDAAPAGQAQGHRPLDGGPCKTTRSAAS